MRSRRLPRCRAEAVQQLGLTSSIDPFEALDTVISAPRSPRTPRCESQPRSRVLCQSSTMLIGGRCPTNLGAAGTEGLAAASSRTTLLPFARLVFAEPCCGRSFVRNRLGVQPGGGAFTFRLLERSAAPMSWAPCRLLCSRLCCLCLYLCLRLCLCLLPSCCLLLRPLWRWSWRGLWRRPLCGCGRCCGRWQPYSWRWHWDGRRRWRRRGCRWRSGSNGH